MSRIAIYADRRFDRLAAKTAVGVIRYRSPDVVAVIDRDHQGKTVAAALGMDIGTEIPVVRDVDAALAFAPDTLLIGIAPRLHVISAELREAVTRAIAAGLDVVSGLHVYLADDPEIAAHAAQRGVRISEVRRPPDRKRVAEARDHPPGSRTVLAVGSDCFAGKMTTTLELDRAARRRGWRSRFLATGQTGIMIADGGLPADAVVSDFLPGLVEDAVLDGLGDAKWLFVEGQGALNHPAAAAVALGLLHGAAPDALIVCHDPRAHALVGLPDHPTPPIADVIRMNEEAVAWVRPDHPVQSAGIALITSGMDEADAVHLIARTEKETGLATTDPVRFGVEPLLDALAAMQVPLAQRSEARSSADDRTSSSSSSTNRT